jgi:hypothetical protein
MELIKFIFKKGDNSHCENYRGINIINVTYKIYFQTVNRGLQNISDYLLSKEQNGIRKGKNKQTILKLI